MGQKTNPISNRLGIIRGWDSNWYGGDNYGDTLVEDSKIRKYLNVRLAKASLSRIIIERTLKLVTITICTARPGFIIGKGGQDVDKLKEELKKITDKDVEINIFEVKRPDLDAQIVANNVARQIEGKIAYRRAVKLAVQNTMKMNAEGIKIQVSGRLNGAEIARSEMFKEGRTPLHTFRADIDYCHAEALTKVGIIGIKVWICRGEIFGKRDLAPHFNYTKDNNFGGGRKEGGRGERNGSFRGRRDENRGGERRERSDNRSERRNNDRNRGGGDRRSGGGFRKDKK
jgi:small subunit ribosomal protein S3